ncbi:Uma2 family endonuclease [Streptomyces sp. 8K308]|uniref:Uma2 family endonuclease n=1 Tax=Streptomyces sp. 8K308 TaxID=2530388 RepID=UPI0010442ACA|nr:Uma2 family endonuclease [Streptomyces sp. 8K308]TDC13040.1 Uma2 family endonuclease [Streptomyces sp. 8K308]
MTATYQEAVEKTVETMSPIENPHDLMRFLEKLPELDHLKIELIDGKIVMQASAAPLHNLIVSELSAQFRAQGWVALGEQALFTPSSSFEPKPDLSVTTLDAVADNANPFPCQRVPLVVEVVSGDKDVDHVKKRFWYGTVSIPLYLLVDPHDGICALHSHPRDHGYRTVSTTEFGEPIELTEPFSFALDTRSFKLYPPKCP